MEKDLSVVRVENLKKVYRAGDTSLTVLEGLDMEVRKGEVAAIVGRSGSGKSTLLNLIGGLDHPTEGKIFVEGERIDNASEESLSVFRNTRIGFIFQFHHLLSEFSVCENVMMPALIRRFDTEWSFGRALELLSMMEIEDKAHAKPSSLSGGESQRVAVARALVNDPRLILADEPTGNLDLKTGERIKDLLFGIIRNLGGTMIVVTHNRLIAQDADTAYRLENGGLNRLIGGSL
ncbi:MAG: ABC transporter ATP-binding protein [Spirochaetes bacterium]|nr:ABC transporter ATP-binding protein [Spirochaetota bacterium]